MSVDRAVLLRAPPGTRRDRRALDAKLSRDRILMPDDSASPTPGRPPAHPAHQAGGHSPRPRARAPRRRALHVPHPRRLRRADFGPSSRTGEFAPLARLRERLLDRVDAGRRPSRRWTRPPLRGSGPTGSSARIAVIGSVLAPADRVSALAMEHVRRAHVLTVPKGTSLAEPVTVTFRGNGGRAYAHLVIDVEPFAEAVVVARPRRQRPAGVQRRDACRRRRLADRAVRAGLGRRHRARRGAGRARRARRAAHRTPSTSRSAATWSGSARPCASPAPAATPSCSACRSPTPASTRRPGCTSTTRVPHCKSRVLVQDRAAGQGRAHGVDRRRADPARGRAAPRPTS